MNGSASGGMSAVLTGYEALLFVILMTSFILSLTVFAEGWMKKKITMVVYYITAIIVTGLSAISLIKIIHLCTG